jgi:hypothetical protein
VHSVPAAGLGHSAHQLLMPSRLISAESGRMTLDLYREVPGVMKLGTRSESTAGHFR